MPSSLDDLRNNLIKQISALTDKDTLLMLKRELSFFKQIDGSDILDGLKPYQLNELTSLANEPSDLDVVNEDDYKMATKKWRSK